MYRYGQFCVIVYLALKLLVRWVWYRPEHLRPGFLRHYFTIRALDFFAILFLCGAFFMLVNTERWLRTFLVIGGMLLYDVLLRALFLHLEARKICIRSPRWTMKAAKRRLRRRARQETPF